jgi:hypothetical protein
MESYRCTPNDDKDRGDKPYWTPNLRRLDIGGNAHRHWNFERRSIHTISPVLSGIDELRHKNWRMSVINDAGDGNKGDLNYCKCIMMPSGNMLNPLG